MYQNIEFIIKDAQWMSINLFLALIPVFFGWLLTKAHKTITKIPLAVVWLIFLPNTIYLLTDIIHLFDDWEIPATFFIKLLLICMYSCLMIAGIFTFILSIHPLEIIFRKRISHRNYLIITVNFLIGLGIVLGRIERTNSWDIFLHFTRFISDTFHVFSSLGTILLCIAFGLLCNIVYFSCRHFIMKEVHEIEKL